MRSFPPLRRAVLAVALLSACLAPATANAAFMHGIQANNSILEEDAAGREKEMRQMAGAGIDILRVTFSWKRVATGAACSTQTPTQLEDPANACYDWSLYDDVVTRAEKHKMQVLASVYQVPQWVLGSGDHYYVGATQADFDKVAERWAAFTKAAATRYSKGASNGFIRYWSIGNEPNSGFFWHEAPNDRFAFTNSVVPKRYAQLFVAAARGIRDVSPEAKIAAGPTGPKGTLAPVTFINATVAEMQKRGGAGLLDAWAHNPYPPGTRGPRTSKTKPPYLFINELPTLFRTLDRHAMTRRKPVWATEFAYQTNPPDRTLGVSYALQATFLAEVYDILATSGRVEMGFWYVFRDNTVKSDWQSGLLDSRSRKKESYAMYGRPISRSAESIRAGKSVRIWGASAIDPASARIMYSFNKRTWRRTPGERAMRNGTRQVTIRPSATVYYRIQDAKGAGPIRMVRVR